MADWNESEITEVVKKISARAAEDAKFHALALQNPAAAIQEISGKAVPAGIKIKFCALEGADFAFVLPDPQVDGELSDSELESVAGGLCRNTNTNVLYTIGGCFNRP